MTRVDRTSTMGAKRVLKGTEDSSLQAARFTRRAALS